MKFLDEKRLNQAIREPASTRLEEAILKIVYGGKPEPISIQIEKGQKNTYAWSIKVYGSDADKIIKELDKIDADLGARFGGVISG